MKENGKVTARIAEEGRRLDIQGHITGCESCKLSKNITYQISTGGTGSATCWVVENHAVIASQHKLVRESWEKMIENANCKPEL